jgi:hypothetical protein
VRGRFVDLVERQLELFEADNADLLQDCRDALDAYNSASKEDAEELYGDYVDAVDTARDALLEYRDAYAASLDEEAAEEYENVFNRLVHMRLPSLGLELDS